MYLEACLQQRQHFSPLVASVDELLGVEASATLIRIASRLTTKWQQPYTRTYGYTKSRTAITLVLRHTGASGVQGAGAQDQSPAPAVGSRPRSQPHQVSMQ